MQVNALDHVNISTTDVGKSARFYADLLDLDVRNGPSPLPAEQVQWLYDANGKAIIHLVNRDYTPGTTGPIHHVALNCTGKDEVITRLRESGAEYAVHEITSLNMTQVFTSDPHGVLLELNFINT